MVYTTIILRLGDAHVDAEKMESLKIHHVDVLELLLVQKEISAFVPVPSHRSKVR